MQDLLSVITTPTGSPATTSVVLLGVVVALSTGLVEVVKVVIGKRSNGKSAPPKECKDCSTKVDTMSRVLSRVDNDGLPLIYFPRTLIRAQTESTDKLRDAVETLSKAMLEKE